MSNGGMMINIQDPANPIQLSDEAIREQLTGLSDEEILRLLEYTKKRKTEDGVMEPRFHILLKELNKRVTPKTQEWFERELRSIVENRASDDRRLNWGDFTTYKIIKAASFQIPGDKPKYRELWVRVLCIPMLSTPALAALTRNHNDLIELLPIWWQKARTDERHETLQTILALAFSGSSDRSKFRSELESASGHWPEDLVPPVKNFLNRREYPTC